MVQILYRNKVTKYYYFGIINIVRIIFNAYGIIGCYGVKNHQFYIEGKRLPNVPKWPEFDIFQKQKSHQMYFLNSAQECNHKCACQRKRKPKCSNHVVQGKFMKFGAFLSYWVSPKSFVFFLQFFKLIKIE